MSDLVMHRTATRRVVQIGDAGLRAIRSDGDPWIVVSTLSEADDWLERHPVLRDPGFERLKDLREYMEAATAVDPWPEEMLVRPTVPVTVKRMAPGLYEVRTDHGTANPLRGTLKRATHRGGVKRWELYAADGERIGAFASLHQARNRSGFLLAEVRMRIG